MQKAPYTDSIRGFLSCLNAAKGAIKMSKIHSVLLTEDYKIAVELENGSSFVYNMRHKLQTMRFAALSDKEYFQKGRLVGDDCIQWSDSLMLYTYEMLDSMKR